MAETWKKVAFEADVITKAFMAAKGDLISASANDTPLILTVGANDLVLTAASGEATGLKWAASGDVSAAAALTDNYLIRGDGGAKGIQVSTIVVDDSGRMLNPSQPCFLETKSGYQSNIAVAEYVTCTFDVEVFDVGNNFASNVFTAPITGKYQLNLTTFVSAIDLDSPTFYAQIETSNKTFWTTIATNKWAVDGNAEISMSILVDMDVNDTAFVRFFIATGGAVQTDIGDGAYFSGALIC